MLAASARFGVVSLSIGLVAAIGHTQQGSLDTAFGTGGRVRVAFDLGGGNVDVVFGLGVQLDGRIVVVGGAEKLGLDVDFAAARLLPDGTLDTSFGDLGRAVVPFDLGDDQLDFATGVAIQADGSIVLVGPVDGPDSDVDMGVVRLDPDGVVDTTFGTAGKTVIELDLGGESGDRPWDVVVQPDGKIVVVGETDGLAGNSDFVISRLTSDGDGDLEFGVSGLRVVFFDLGGNKTDVGGAVALQTDGKIVVAGLVTAATGDGDFGIIRLNSNSTDDSGFGSGGKAIVSFNLGGENGDWATCIALQEDGKIVLAGPVEAADGSWDFGVVRLEADGDTDPTFSGDGKTTVAFSPGEDDFPTGVAITPDGAILVAGTVDGVAGSRNFGIVRLQPNGELDTSFGTGGKAFVAFDLGGSDEDECRSLALPSSGGIVLAGIVEVDGTGPDFGVAKLYGSLAFADGFETGDPSAWSHTIP